MNSNNNDFLEQHMYSLSIKFRSKIKRLTEICFDRGVVMCPVESLRDPWIQAKYWRQSRSEIEILEEIDKLRDSEAHFLADCIDHAICQSGPRITNAIPGLSWHQWGEAIDFVWIPENKAVWDINIKINYLNGYQIFGEEAKKLGLECGLFWSDFVDASHVQLRSTAHPGMLYSIEYINNEMEQRFHR